MTTLAPTDKDIARFNSKYTVKGDCHEWNTPHSTGYGYFYLKTDTAAVMHRAHRISYAIHFGDIPDGIQVDHVCYNKACVNPAAMALVVMMRPPKRIGDGMPKGWRPCPKPHCPEPTPPTQRFCDAHMVEYEQSRGTKTERGYGKDFQQLRVKWGKRIASGIVNCKRCRKWINPSESWHLDHDDNDRDNLALASPSHALCNLSAGGKASHRGDRGPLPPTPPPF